MSYTYVEEVHLNYKLHVFQLTLVFLPSMSGPCRGGTLLLGRHIGECSDDIFIRFLMDERYANGH